MSVKTDPPLGTDLAGYRLESVVGRGGMGVVYLAQDLRLKRRVALKLISPELAADPRFRERFLRESELAASLDHSHVVPVHAAGETDGQLWIAMRYVEGEDLQTLLEREGPLAPERALALCTQVAEALDAAHGRGLVHRDVKPANVLVTDEGGREHCYLSDFGLARSPGADPGAPTHLSGTVDYTAPEQIAHEPFDQRADVYSLACVLFECLAGAPPFARPRPMATLFAHAQEPPPSLHERRPELPSGIDAVLARGLAKEPEERYESCRELIDAAREALGLETQRRFSRRRLLVIGAAGAIAVAAAAAVPAILLGGGESGPKVALPVTENTLLRLDPETGEPTAAVQLGEDPTHLAAGEGSLWVVDSRELALLRVDPERDAVVDSVDISPVGPVELGPGDKRLLVGAGAVWLPSGYPEGTYDGTYVWEYDPGSSSLAKFALGRGVIPSLVEARADGVWIHDNVRNALMRLDPASGRVLDTRTVRREQYPTWWAIGEQAGWFWRNPPDAETGVLERIDLETGEVVASVAPGFTTIAEMAVGAGGVWVLGDGESLIRIDPATNSRDREIRVGRSADMMALGEGFVWVGSRRDGTVTRVDPETADLLTMDVGGQPRAIAVGEGSVWVIVRPS